MIRRCLLGLLAWSVAVLVCVLPSFAQTLLERLERRLGEAAPLVAPARPTVSPVVRALASFEPGYLGVVTHESGGRVVVSSVRAKSPGERAGMRAGDELIAVNGRRTTTVEEFAAAVEPFPPGAKLTFEVRRAGRRERLVAVLDDAAPGRGAPPREQQAVAFLVERPTIGVRVGAVNDAARREYQLTTKRGALVGEVAPGGPIAKAGIGVGAVIVAVDGRRIDTPQDLSQLIRNARVGQELELTYYERDQLRRKRVRVASTEPTLDAPEELEALRTPPGEARVAAPEAPVDDPLETEAVAAPPRLVERVPERAPPERGQTLKKLERAIENFTRPAAPPTEAPPPPRDTTEAHLRLEIETLRTELAEVRRRLAELERRVAVPKPKPGLGADEDPNDDRPKLDEPPAPAKEPELKLGAPKLEAPANEPK